MEATETVESVPENSGSKWLRSAGVKEISPVGIKVAGLLDQLALGIYHLDNPQKVDWSNPRYIAVKWFGSMATFDFNQLTRLVVLAHDMCIRADIAGLSRNYLQITFHPRTLREGRMSERHPTLEEHIQQLRGGK
jgi:hypothetical protein